MPAATAEDDRYISANVSIRGDAPYAQSHLHDAPRLEGESHEDYDKRTWKHKMNVAEIDGVKTIVIPAFGIKLALVAGARFSKKQIPGQGKSTWTKRFESGISVITDGVLNIDPEAIKEPIKILANSDGVRGSGKRVPRYLPQIPSGWEATFSILVLDAMITEEVFTEMLRHAGMFIGVGQFRPENGGHNGRFRLLRMGWDDARKAIKRR